MGNMKSSVDLSVTIAGLAMRNPVMTASGTFGYAREFEPLIDLNRLGGIVVKGLSLEPTHGNPPPRIVETPCGMLNAIGLENVGVEHFIKDKLPFLTRLQPPIVANIYGKTIEEYADLAARIDDEAAIAGVEVNISCPNVKSGGVIFGVDARAAYDVVHAVRRRFSRTVIVKLSPNVTDITVIARSVEEAGADGLSLINTITGMAIDIHSRKPKLANTTGGLSGPAIKPVAVRMVWQVAQTAGIPIIGIGGIQTAEDAIEFFLAGASAIQVGTANFVNPRATMDVLDGIGVYLREHNIPRLADLVGDLKNRDA
ncbi:Dihydroorotate dehydrogenase (NAD(+)), catalytic subunit (EC [Olavius algarvensis associated proteobacterium Delta 3]|nr:Dihydroorotate dehydrogenase (NAD(+)), catalytic subunit (EC [Olavius algarvensis associated proteobacterium Delta 3]CAB5158320.1 Dihydroorotate dehydrogenase (NAD(+)), catalytic subunit (EC [Olavius algarvensis associated proteobacterium Delta 3]